MKSLTIFMIALIAMSAMAVNMRRQQSNANFLKMRDDKDKTKAPVTDGKDGKDATQQGPKDNDPWAKLDRKQHYAKCEAFATQCDTVMKAYEAVKKAKGPKAAGPPPLFNGPCANVCEHCSDFFGQFEKKWAKGPNNKDGLEPGDIKKGCMMARKHRGHFEGHQQGNGCKALGEKCELFRPEMLRDNKDGHKVLLKALDGHRGDHGPPSRQYCICPLPETGEGSSGHHGSGEGDSSRNEQDHNNWCFETAMKCGHGGGWGKAGRRKRGRKGGEKVLIKDAGACHQVCTGCQHLWGALDRDLPKLVKEFKGLKPGAVTRKCKRILKNEFKHHGPPPSEGRHHHHDGPPTAANGRLPPAPKDFDATKQQPTKGKTMLVKAQNNGDSMLFAKDAEAEKNSHPRKRKERRKKRKKRRRRKKRGGKKKDTDFDKGEFTEEKPEKPEEGPHEQEKGEHEEHEEKEQKEEHKKHQKEKKEKAQQKEDHEKPEQEEHEKSQKEDLEKPEKEGPPEKEEKA